MDPDVLLASLRALALDIVDNYGDGDATYDMTAMEETALNLAAQFLNMDAWMIGGGLAPSEWRPKS